MKRCLRGGIGLAWLLVSGLGRSSVAHGAESILEARRGGPGATPKAVTLTTSLITPFFGAYYLEANVRVARSLGLVFNTSYLVLEDDDWRTRTGTVGAGLVYYFRADAPRGWYVEAIAELMASSWRHEPSDRIASLVLGYSAVVVGGYRFVHDCGPVLDLAAGAVVLRFPSARVGAADDSVARDAFVRVYPAAKVNVGWAF